MNGALSCTAVWHTLQRASVRPSWLTGSGASRPSAWQVVHPSFCVDSCSILLGTSGGVDVES